MRRGFKKHFFANEKKRPVEVQKKTSKRNEQMQEDGTMKRSLLIVSLMLTIMVTNKVYALTIAPVNKLTATETETIETKANELKTEVRTYYDVPLDMGFQDYIREECINAGLDMELVLAIMKVESDFNSEVISSTDDFGLMQVNKINFEEVERALGLTNMLDPHQGAKAGIYLLSKLKWCESEHQMLMAYNMGVTGAQRLWKEGIYETNYSKKVLKAKELIGGNQYEITVFCNQEAEW